MKKSPSIDILWIDGLFVLRWKRYKYWRPAEIASKGPARKANCGAKEKAITEFFQILYTEQWPNNPVERNDMKGIQSNGFLPIIAQAIAEMEELHGEFASINEINLADLGRRTGISLQSCAG